MAGYGDGCEDVAKSESLFLASCVSLDGSNAYHCYQSIKWVCVLPDCPSLQLHIDPMALQSWMPGYGMLLEVDWEGNILRSFHDPTGTVVTEASEVVERPGGKMWIGSFQAPYVVEFDLPE